MREKQESLAQRKLGAVHSTDPQDNSPVNARNSETQRELCTDIRDLHVSMITYRMNEIIKVLTIIATIFIPLSFIASVYGMNFRADESHPLNMPELAWKYGYLFALGLMALTALGFLAYFWRKGWLEFDRDHGEIELEERR